MKDTKPEKKKLYLNPIAILFLIAKQTNKILIAGRAFGKSFLIGVSIMIKVWLMPRSQGLLIGPTYTQILTAILLPMKSAWHWLGYKEGEDYVVGKRPPKHFEEPYLKPERYENVITFWNGTSLVMGSMDRPHLMRGGNYDWLLGDEVLRIEKRDYEDIVIPTVRGSHMIFKGTPGHLSKELFSSMPYGTKGTWLLEKKVEAENPDNNIFYIEGTTWHNRKIVGDNVILEWRRTMSHESYMREIMNIRQNQHGNVFYPSLRDRHWYTNTANYKYIDTLGTDPEKLKQDCRWDNDYDADREINISHDFGAFNCITIDQQWESDPRFGNKETVRMINFMHVQHPRVLKDLANDFCEYYKHAKLKRVIQWGDKSGNKAEANSRLTYFEEFASILEEHGWQVIPADKGDAGHLARHKFIIDLHREEDPRLPVVRYNDNNCKDLRIALYSTPMVDDKKDKSSERNKNIKQQHATHGTDAHDYRLWWAFRPRVQESTYSSPVSFGGR